MICAAAAAAVAAAAAEWEGLSLMLQIGMGLVRLQRTNLRHLMKVIVGDVMVVFLQLQQPVHQPMATAVGAAELTTVVVGVDAACIARTRFASATKKARSKVRCGLIVLHLLSVLRLLLARTLEVLSSLLHVISFVVMLSLLLALALLLLVLLLLKMLMAVSCLRLLDPTLGPM